MEKTPTRESPLYRWGQLPDHGADGLYLQGPEDAVGLWELQASTLAQEAIALDDAYGQRLHDWQRKDARYNVVQFLALAPHLWNYVKLAMVIGETPLARRAEIRQWLKEAREMRQRLQAASKREALRLATR